MAAPGRAPDDAAMESVYRGLVALYHRADESLRRLDSGSFLIVRYPDLVADPMTTVERVYRHFGLPWEPELVARLEQRLRAATRRSHSHGYSLDDFPITAERIEADLGFVMERYGL